MKTTRSELIYCGRVVRRSGISGPPKSYLEAGEWPTGRVSGPPEAAYAIEVARHLKEAIGDGSLRALGRQAGLNHTTISAVLAGKRWPDFMTIARLEQALGVRLWPDGIN